ncbi:MAG: DUF2313 domain-containing protein [Epulopiscium sp.]|mgnify:CR=1 FL=1|nr:DUF2313 domain-containing protein [Candidatus Epulonipiscium sp.]
MVDILEYLPDEISELREFKAIGDTENLELISLWEELEDILDDQFIETATERGIAKREKIIGITPFADDDLESRRFRVLARENDKLPYTYKALIARLNQLCGEDGYEIDRNVGDFSLSIKIELIKKKMFEEVEKVLDAMVPQNMIFTVELRYNQYSKLANYTHTDLSYYSHKEIREEVMS